MLNSKDIARTLVSAVATHPEKRNELVVVLGEYLRGKKLLQLAPRIIEEIESEVQSRKSKKGLFVDSAYLLSTEHLEAVKELVGAEESVPVETDIDEALVCGFVAHFDGKRYDASGKRFLKTVEIALAQ